MIQYRGLNSARMKDVLYILPKAKAKIRNYPLPTIENIEGCCEEVSDDDLQGDGLEIIIPSNIIDIYTRLKILLGLKLSGHPEIPTEASNLLDELYKNEKYKTNNIIEMLSINFIHIKWIYSAKYLSKSHLKQDVKYRSIYWMSWIRVHTKSIYQLHCKLIKINLNSNHIPNWL